MIPKTQRYEYQRICTDYSRIPYAYVNFDDERLYKLESADLNSLLEALYMVYGNYPISFTEFCQYRKIDTKDILTRGVAFKKATFEEYLTKGGFPELFEVKNSRGYIQEKQGTHPK